MVEVLQPNFICETNWTIYQTDLPHAIKMAAKFPSSHPMKTDRLEFVTNLILNGADPMRKQAIYGEECTPMSRALEFGDAQTIQAIKDAMEKFKKGPPLVVVQDPEMLREDESQKKLPVALIFPGQGSQYVGMLADCKDLEPCQKLIEKAKEILGYDILDLCLNGPESKLEETKYCQPALFLANACAVEKLRMENPQLVNRIQAVAGLSLGEYNAICFSEMATFEVCLRMVRTRADAMDVESRRTPQALISVAGLDLAVLKTLCEQSAKRAGKTPDGQDEVCVVASQLFPKGYTCSGTKKAIEILKAACENEGALQARFMKQTCAFHTDLMSTAGVKLNKALRANVATMTFPKCDLYMNVTGSYRRAGTDPREVNMDLTAQVSSPVLWQQLVEEMIKQGITDFYECGPMKQLKAMMKRIDTGAWEKTKNVNV
jgi:[acyl-carrier-protein] S-malonyltransferase